MKLARGTGAENKGFHISVHVAAMLHAAPPDMNTTGSYEAWRLFWPLMAGLLSLLLPVQR